MKTHLTRLIGGLPHELKRPLKRLRYFPQEAAGWLRAETPTIPPRWLRFDSESDFSATGDHLLELCREYGQLAEDEYVLDAGCGVGRLALPLTSFLSPQGRYAGFDVDKAAIEWCQNNISNRRNDFRFTHVQVANDHYNRHGSADASSFRFPYEDGQFDLAVATSLFTHLMSADAAHYLREMGRVLKPGGRALITWYVADDDTSQGQDYELKFHRRLDESSFTANPGNPCAAIAFTRDFITRNCVNASLKCEGDIHLGEWRNIAGPTYQDMLVVVKTD